MEGIDSRTKLSRGYFLLSKGHKECSNSACKLRATTWSKFSSELITQLPLILHSENPKTVSEVIHLIFLKFNEQIAKLITLNRKSFENTMQVMSETPLYTMVKATFEQYSLQNVVKFSPEFGTLILLAFPSQVYKELSAPLRSEFHTLRNLDVLPANLTKEVLQLRYQMNLSHCILYIIFFMLNSEKRRISDILSVSKFFKIINQNINLSPSKLLNSFQSIIINYNI